MTKMHDYTCRIRWTGDRGAGTASYRGYDRTWEVATPGKPPIACSNDPLLGGDPALPNPEDLLLASLAACHMLWYLHLASVAGIVVHDYADDPVGTGELASDGSGRFTGVTLRPQVTLALGSDVPCAEALHHEVGRYCIIARSVAFPVSYAPHFSLRPD